MQLQPDMFSPFAAETDKMIRRAEASRDEYKRRADYPGMSLIRRTELRGKTIAMEQIAERLRAERDGWESLHAL